MYIVHRRRFQQQPPAGLVVVPGASRWLTGAEILELSAFRRLTTSTAIARKDFSTFMSCLAEVSKNCML